MPGPRFAFTVEVIEWRGPAPFYFAAIPDDHTAALRDTARAASYGWGVIPVAAELAGVAFTTSLFPRGGRYLVPLKDKVRRAAGVVVGDPVEIALAVAPRR